jgi:hypothetical protein
LGVIILAFSGDRLRVSYRTPLTGCAHDDGTGGASGVFRWADRLGIPVRTMEVPVWEAPEILAEPTGNCIVTMGDGAWSPMEEEMGPENWLSASGWVARGNALIIITTAPEKLPKTLREDLKLSALQETVAKRGAFLGRGSVENRPDTCQASLTHGGSLTVEREGPRWSVPAPEQVGAATPTKGAAPPVRDDGAARWQLAADATGGVLFRFPVGHGAVYVLLDEFAWTNAGFDQGDNARELAGILSREIHGGAFVFDEYRHGHGRVESFVTYFANLPGATAFSWIALIWALLYAYGRNVRLKPVEAYVERERRTAQEYIDAVAQLYERARAAPLVVEAVARRVRQVARSAAERPASVDAALLQRADDYTKTALRPAYPKDAIHLVRELIQLRKRIYGTRTIS